MEKRRRRREKLMNDKKIGEDRGEGIKRQHREEENGERYEDRRGMEQDEGEKNEERKQIRDEEDWRKRDTTRRLTKKRYRIKEGGERYELEKEQVRNEEKEEEDKKRGRVMKDRRKKIEIRKREKKKMGENEKIEKEEKRRLRMGFNEDKDEVLRNSIVHLKINVCVLSASLDYPTCVLGFGLGDVLFLLSVHPPLRRGWDRKGEKMQKKLQALRKQSYIDLVDTVSGELIIRVEKFPKSPKTSKLPQGDFFPFLFNHLF
ncbi:hypothetical protein Tco_0432692 [Tanacetum coccineum]